MNDLLKVYLTGSLINLLIVLIASIMFKKQYNKAMSEIPSYYFFINQKVINLLMIITLIIKSWVGVVQVLIFMYDYLQDYIIINTKNEKENWEKYILPTIIFYNYNHHSLEEKDKEKGFCICFTWWTYILEIDIYFN